MNIRDIIQTVWSLPDCEVYPPNGLPAIAKHHRLPKDVESFYNLCGGMVLFSDSAFPTNISSPDRLTLANPVIFNDASEEDLVATKHDLSWSWYLIGTGPNAQYITIDFAPERLGHCYNSFWILHPSNSPIIAWSLTDLLAELLITKGEYYYWDTADFQPLGNPYI